MSTPTPRREALPIGEAARRLGIHRDTLRAAIRRGEIPATRIGRRWLVPVAALDRLLHPDASPSSDEASGWCPVATSTRNSSTGRAAMS
jgi:excisionase family DNA binding protein